MLLIAPSGSAGGEDLPHDDDRKPDRASSVLAPPPNAGGGSARGVNVRQLSWSRRLSVRRGLSDGSSADVRVLIEIARADPEQYVGTRGRL